MEYNIDNKSEIVDLKNAIQFQADDDINVVDLEADKIQDLKNSYIGKYIAQCDICGQLIYTEDKDLEKIEACPYCGFNHCFYLIGKVESIPMEKFADDLAEKEDNKLYTKTELVYGEAVEGK